MLTGVWAWGVGASWGAEGGGVAMRKEVGVGVML